MDELSNHNSTNNFNFLFSLSLDRSDLEEKQFSRIATFMLTFNLQKCSLSKLNLIYSHVYIFCSSVVYCNFDRLERPIVSDAMGMNLNHHCHKDIC